MGEPPESARSPENPVTEFSDAITDFIRKELKGHGFPDLAIEAVLAEGLPALHKLPLRELLQAQMVTLGLHLPDTERFLVSFGCNRSEAEEVAAEALVSALQWLADGNLPRAPRKWFLKVAENLCRRQKKKPGVKLLDQDATGALVGNGLAPDQQAEWNEQKVLLETQLKKLRDNLDPDEVMILRLLMSKATSKMMLEETGWNEKKAPSSAEETSQ